MVCLGTPFGYYMYYDSVKYNNTSHTSTLISPSATMHGNVYIKFAYHMYGDSIGNLTVYYRVITGIQGSYRVKDYLLMSKSSNQGNVWYTFSRNLTFYSNASVQVAFCLILVLVKLCSNIYIFNENKIFKVLFYFNVRKTERLFYFPFSFGLL